MPVVSWYHVWNGVAEAGTGAPNQLVIYGPLQPFFDKTWRPDDIVEVK
jgi:hypothetical protein